MTRPVFRFAPSPNGHLHLGHALSALINFDMARAIGGRFLLRIEDIDGTRCRPEFEAAIVEDLAWLGVEWEEPVRRQSEQFDQYRAALDTLDARKLAYPAFESRAEIARMVADLQSHAPWPRDPDGAPVYPGAARMMAPRGARGANRRRRALCDPARHRAGFGMDRGAGRGLVLERDRRGTSRRDGRLSLRGRRTGATSLSAARRRRRATIWRW